MILSKIKIEKYMRLALELAKRAQGNTFPNPLVGAVIVKNGKVIGRGFHKKAGGPHAEIFALKQAGFKARGAALFCTFEPCSHYGRTGPCVDEIIRFGIKEVYVGMIDPNPKAKGNGIFRLKKNRIKVRTGYLEEEISNINEPFIKAMTKRLPLVTIKIAQSLDGKVATRCGESKWITSDQARAFSHDIRRYYDGIMVGVNTVLNDDPVLEPSEKFYSHGLAKIIVDSRMRIPLSSKLFKHNQTVVVATMVKNADKEKQLARLGATVIRTKSKNGMIDLMDLLKKMNSLEIRNILVEGGPSLIGSFLDNRLADKALIFIAPKIIGGDKALTSVRGKGISALKHAIRLENVELFYLRDDLLVQGDLRYD